MSGSEYYLEYNRTSLTFPRNIFHAPKLRTAAALASGLPDNSRVLDAGCGAGWVSDGLEPRLKLTGVDLEPEAIAFCQAHRRGTFLQARLEALPFPDGHFDLVLFTNTIEHLIDPYPALAELARVLKPGAQMFVTTENCANLFWLVLEQTWYRVFGGPCKPYRREVHPQRYTPALLRAHLSRGLKVVSLTQAVLGMELLALAEKPKGTSKA